MKKAIITGATGFIGSAFVEYLSKRDVQVLAIGRKPMERILASKRDRLKLASYLELDMDDIHFLQDRLPAIGWKTGDECIFFNLAWGGEKGLSDLNISAQMQNVTRSVSALEVAKNIGCSRFIQVGTMEEAFTKKYMELDYRQNTQYNRHVIYSVSKMAARRALEVKASQLGIEFIYVLHSHVMGVGDDKDSFLQVTLKKLIRGEDLIFSSGEQYFDVISVNDCSLGYYLICQKGKPGSSYWVGSGEPKRLREYVERMYALYPSGVKMQFGKLPYNDIILDKSDFSIGSLVEDTGYHPTMSYEQTVKVLYDHLVHSENVNSGG